MNLFISNISYNTGAAELDALFSAHGTVISIRLVTDKETGRPRGFGFIEMSAAQEGEKAIAALNNKEIEGRPLSVSIARERTERFSKSNNRQQYSRSSAYSKKW